MSEPVRDFTSGPSYLENQPRVGVAERSHEAIREQLSEALEGSLGPDEERTLRAHLDECRACAAFNRTLRATVRLARELPGIKAPDAAKRRVLDALP